MRQQERETTYAIERTGRQLMWKNDGVPGKAKSIVKFVLFELTSDYGMSPGQPLLDYTGSISHLFNSVLDALNTKGMAGIWQDWEKDGGD